MPPIPPDSLKIYGTTTINEKGQIVIPAEARAELGLTPGTRMMIMRAPFADAIAVVKTAEIEKQMHNWTQALDQPQLDNPEV